MNIYQKRIMKFPTDEEAIEYANENTITEHTLQHSSYCVYMHWYERKIY